MDIFPFINRLDSVVFVLKSNATKKLALKLFILYCLRPRDVVCVCVCFDYICPYKSIKLAIVAVWLVFWKHGGICLPYSFRVHVIKRLCMALCCASHNEIASEESAFI